MENDDGGDQELDLMELSAAELAECGLTMDDLKEMRSQKPTKEERDDDDEADLLEELKAIHSGSSINEDDLQLSDDEILELPSPTCNRVFSFFQFTDSKMVEDGDFADVDPSEHALIEGSVGGGSEPTLEPETERSGLELPACNPIAIIYVIFAG
jgi:hypothetical protein